MQLETPHVPLFDVFNLTDGVYATHMPLEDQAADQFIEDFPKRYELQGYYTTQNWERIDPRNVRLMKLPHGDADAFAQAMKIRDNVNVYDGDDGPCYSQSAFD
jgi:hypothetical protein